MLIFSNWLSCPNHQRLNFLHISQFFQWVPLGRTWKNNEPSRVIKTQLSLNHEQKSTWDTNEPRINYEETMHKPLMNLESTNKKLQKPRFTTHDTTQVHHPLQVNGRPTLTIRTSWFGTSTEAGPISVRLTVVVDGHQPTAGCCFPMTSLLGMHRHG